MIIAVGFKINNERAVQFRKWANQIVKDYTIQGWAMDDDRLKQGGSILTKDYFEKQLEKIREIRLSEHRFYQKITDIYATKEHMGFTTWEGAADGKIHKYDVTVGKNYLTQEELQLLERLVSSYLDFAEMQTSHHIPMTMEDWETRLNGFLTLWNHDVLKDNGRISTELAKLKAETELEKYRLVQDQTYLSDFDRFMMLEQHTKNN